MMSGPQLGPAAVSSRTAGVTLRRQSCEFWVGGAAWDPRGPEPPQDDVREGPSKPEAGVSMKEAHAVPVSVMTLAQT